MRASRRQSNKLNWTTTGKHLTGKGRQEETRATLVPCCAQRHLGVRPGIGAGERQKIERHRCVIVVGQWRILVPWDLVYVYAGCCILHCNWCSMSLTPATLLTALIKWERYDRLYSRAQGTWHSASELLNWIIYPPRSLMSLASLYLILLVNSYSVFAVMVLHLDLTSDNRKLLLLN